MPVAGSVKCLPTTLPWYLWCCLVALRAAGVWGGALAFIAFGWGARAGAAVRVGGVTHFVWMFLVDLAAFVFGAFPASVGFGVRGGGLVGMCVGALKYWGCLSLCCRGCAAFPGPSNTCVLGLESRGLS